MDPHISAYLDDFQEKGIIRFHSSLAGHLQEGARWALWHPTQDDPRFTNSPVVQWIEAFVNEVWGVEAHFWETMLRCFPPPEGQGGPTFVYFNLWTGFLTQGPDGLFPAFDTRAAAQDRIRVLEELVGLLRLHHMVARDAGRPRLAASTTLSQWHSLKGWALQEEACGRLVGELVPMSP